MNQFVIDRRLAAISLFQPGIGSAIASGAVNAVKESSATSAWACSQRGDEPRGPPRDPQAAAELMLRHISSAQHRHTAVDLSVDKFRVDESKREHKRLWSSGASLRRATACGCRRFS